MLFLLQPYLLMEGNVAFQKLFYYHLLSQKGKGDKNDLFKFVSLCMIATSKDEIKCINCFPEMLRHTFKKKQ
jgi:hypothetical protein